MTHFVQMNIFVYNIYTSTEQENNKPKKPPCMSCYKDMCSCLKKPFDSMMGQGWNFREFVVYDNNVCYPEYIIYYTRH